MEFVKFTQKTECRISKTYDWGTAVSPCRTHFTYATTCGTKTGPCVTLCYFIVLHRDTNLPIKVLQIIMLSFKKVMIK